MNFRLSGKIFLPTFTQTYPNMPHISLKTIPPDIYQFILKTQGEAKVEKKSSQYSLEKTIIKMLKDLKEFKEKKNQ